MTSLYYIFLCALLACQIYEAHIVSRSETWSDAWQISFCPTLGLGNYYISYNNTHFSADSEFFKTTGNLSSGLVNKFTLITLKSIIWPCISAADLHFKPIPKFFTLARTALSTWEILHLKIETFGQHINNDWWVDDVLLSAPSWKMQVKEGSRQRNNLWRKNFVEFVENV